MLYVAYGSNLNKDQMNYRVPGVKPYGKGVIYNWQLSFHGNDGTAYATITRAPGKKVPVVLWELSDKQESVMDRYEGYPKAYYKRKIPVHINGKRVEGLVYIMNENRRVARPSRKYVNTVRQGYDYFGLDIGYLDEALVRNSTDYYMDDLLEVREFKTLNNKPKKTVVTVTKGKKGKKYKETFAWKTTSSSSYVRPVTNHDRLRRAYDDSPELQEMFPYYIDYVDAYESGRPSLDYYDNMRY